MGTPISIGRYSVGSGVQEPLPGPVLLLPLARCGTSLSWASVSPSVKWNEHSGWAPRLIGKNLKPRVKSTVCSLHLILQIIACSLLAPWSSVAVLSFRNYVGRFGQLVRRVVLAVVSWPVEAALCGSCDPLPTSEAPRFLTRFCWPGPQPSQCEGRLFSDKGPGCLLSWRTHLQLLALA